MTTEKFEKAIEALSIQGLELIRISKQLNGDVAAAYAKMGELTWIKWDHMGRGFRFEQPADIEGCISSDNVMYLAYDRDSYLDLKFS